MKKRKTIKAWAVMFSDKNDICLYKDGFVAISDYNKEVCKIFARELSKHLSKKPVVVPIEIKILTK